MGGLLVKQPIPVSNVNLKRYSGKWFQIAASKTFFNTKDYTNVTADYELIIQPSPVGPVQLRITNTAQTSRGIVKITGLAWPDDSVAYSDSYRTDDEGDPILLGCLLVRFNSTPQFRTSSDLAAYWILELDKTNYSYALVGGPDKTTAYILSRTPTLPLHIRRSLEAALVDTHGYPANAVREPNWIVTRHNPEPSSSGPELLSADQL